MTAQEVIKKFFNQLANHGYANSDSVGVNMLDSAVRASSRYSDIQEVIDAMKSDQTAAEMEAVEEVLGSDYAGKTLSEIDSTILSADAKTYDTDNKSNAYKDSSNDSRSTVENFIKERMAYIFLEKYCGIILNQKFFFNKSGTADTWGVSTGNVDTGAITGSDAGTSSVKTASSVVSEIFINTYTAATSTPQNIITNDRDWVVQATDADDTITANGADSINAGLGNDSILANADGSTITSGDGNDFITISKGVTDITLNDLNSYDTLTISGTFEVGSAHIEDSLLVVTDKTGTRKIRLGDFDTAKDAKINSTTISRWLTNAGIDLDNLATKNYSEGKVLSSSNVANATSDSAITVDLDDVDTSAAGKISIGGSVVGTLSSTFPNAATFTRNGLTLHLLGVANDTSGDVNNITSKTLDELTDDQKTIIAGLFKWWLGSSLTLGEESFGISLNSATAAVKDIGLFFYDSNGSGTTLAATPYWPRSADGASTQLMLKINLSYFKNLSADNVDGSSSATTNLLDRTLAHELTHSNMASNINYFVTLPQFIIEGAAELVHGIDDERGKRIFTIAATASTLDTVLDVSNTSTGNNDFYAGGYMFMRYFAKQAAAQTLPAFGEITATVNLNRNGSYYISGNSTTETASAAAQSINLGTASRGVYTVKNTGVHQVINNANSFKVVGLTVNDTLIGSDATDIVETAEGSYITSGNGADSIKINGQFATIDAGAGNDTVIATEGGHHFINLGDGNDFINLQKAESYLNTVNAGAGNDYIISYGTSAYIDGGADNDRISLYGAAATVDASAGNDTIFVGNGVASFNVADFGAGDVIQLNATVDNLATTDGGIVAGSVTIAGLDLSATTEGWAIDSDVATYLAETLAGAILSGNNKISYSSVTGEETLVEVSGVKSLDDISLSGKVVTVGESSLDTLTVTISDGYSLALASDVETSTTREAAWSLSGTTAIYSTSATTAGYTLDDNQIIYTEAIIGEVLVEVSGVTATGGLDIDTENKIVTVGESSLDTLTVTISDDYSLAVASDVATSTTREAAWSLSGTTAIYSTSATTAGYTLEDNQIFYTEASGGEALVEVSGVKSLDDISLSGKVVTVGESSLDTLTVTISDDYSLALASDVATPSTREMSWNLNGTTAIYSVSATTAGYTLDDNQIIYTAATGGETLVEVSGVTATGGLAIDTDNKIVTVGESSLDTLTVTISDDYSLALASDVKISTREAAWSLSGTTAIYSMSATTEGYTLDDNQIFYTEATSGETLIDLRGIASAPTVKGNVVKLAPKNFAGNVSVVAGGGYNFELGGGNYARKTFSGSADDDFITTKGSALIIQARGGQDTIAGYTAKNKISLAAQFDFAVDGDDVIFNFDENSLTIQDGAGKKINVNSSVNYYTADGIFDSLKKSVTLAADVENFTAAAALTTIDGSATDSISIVGNGKANIIYAGTGGSTLAGGRGRDTLHGGDGADIFIYSKGKDIIEDCAADDTISLGSDASLKSFKVKKDDAIIKVKGGSVTVKDSAEFRLVEGGAEKIFNDGNLFSTDKTAVTLSSAFKGTFELDDYKSVDASFTNKKVTLAGNDADNYLVGGKGKDCLTGGAGNDTLWGGKKNDTLAGGDGDDVFIFQAGGGKDFITDYQSGELITILNKKGDAGTFKKATFKDDTLTLAISGGGKIILSDVDASTTFNINGKTHHVEGNSLS